MEFDGFDWDEGTSSKCCKHGLTLAEIEGTFASEVWIGPDPYPIAQERRFRAVGVSTAGRHVFIVFTLRKCGRLVPDTCMPRKFHAMKKKFPQFETDEEAENFVETADLSEYDFSDMTPVRFELRRKDRSVSLRLPESLLGAARARAEEAGMPYQRFMRLAIERALLEPPFRKS